MKAIFLSLFVLLCLSCEDFSENNEEAIKIEQKNETVFKSISKKWSFNFPEARPETKNAVKDWKYWNQFKNELQEKPKTSLLAFKMKVKNVSVKADSLNFEIPTQLDIPQVRSRLVTLTTKIKSLDTFIHLQNIPEKRILTLIDEINEEIRGVYNQWDEVYIKLAIPKEFGEDYLLRALDTTRFANKRFQEEIIEKDSIKTIEGNKLIPKKK
jgi:hypothetical protein